jgi:hypothetical protein
LKQPNSGQKFGHGAKNRPDRVELRAKDRDERLAVLAAAASADDIHTDDEDMQALYDLINKKRIDFSGVDDEDLNKPLPPIGERKGEELWQRQDAVRSDTFEGAFNIPDQLKGKVKLVRDDFDELAQTDVELSEDEIDTVVKSDDETGPSDAEASGGEGRRTVGKDVNLLNGYAEADPAQLAAIMKRGDQRVLREADKLPGSPIAKALADLRRKRARPSTHDAPAAAPTTQADNGVRDPREARQQRKVQEARAAANTLADLLAESGDEASTRRSDRGKPRSSSASADQAVASDSRDSQSKGTSAAAAKATSDGYESPHSRAFHIDDSDGEIAPYPQLPLPRRSLFNVAGLASKAAEDDALLDEQARQLLDASNSKGKEAASADHVRDVKAAKTKSDLVSLSGDDSSDWGGDDLDPRYHVDPLTLMRDFRKRYNIGDSDAEAQELLELGVDAAGTRINSAFGDGIEKIPDSILQELATPYDFTEQVEGKPYPDAETLRGTFSVMLAVLRIHS